MPHYSPTSSEFDFDHYESELVLITTYTNIDVLAHTPAAGDGKGIYAFDLSTSTGRLQPRGVLEVGPNPAFLVKHPSLPILYGTTECIHEEGDILTLGLASTSPSGVKLLGRKSAGGRSTCYINVADDGKHLTAVNYWDAKVCSFPLDTEGRLGDKSCTHIQPGAEYVDAHNPDRMEHWTFRQRWPHTHCAETEPYTGNNYTCVCDLGLDEIIILKLDQGKLINAAQVSLQPGLGPRHVVFHPRVPMAYIVNELTSSVSALKFNVKELNGQREDSLTLGAILEHVDTISCLPVDWQDKQTSKNGVWKAASHAAEIRIHPSGKLLFVANRGHDSLAIYKIDEENGGTISLSQIVSSNGECPRNYNFSRTGRWVIVGNQNSNNVTVFECDVNAGTMFKVQELPCPSPNFVYAVPADVSSPRSINDHQGSRGSSPCTRG